MSKICQSQWSLKVDEKLGGGMRELTEKELEQVAGGGTTTTTTQPPIKASPIKGETQDKYTRDPLF
jgi:bacteriocin-like protein